MTGLPATDAAIVESWWQHFVATGCLPAELPLVQGRLVRAVHRGVLPSGPVFVKVMTFPRGKDRLRYLLRALPGEHEARMLAAVRAAGVPCPEVVAVHTLRRFGLPARSLLVLRALPLAPAAAGADTGDPLARLREAAAIVRTLLLAGIEHHDLHDGNFVRLADGRLAVLDLQSARRRQGGGDAARLAAAARLVRDRQEPAAALAAALQAGGLLHDAAEAAQVLLQRTADERRFQRSRALRCLRESTTFTWRLRASGREFRRRDCPPDGRWVRGGAELRQAWIGQWCLQSIAGEVDRGDGAGSVFGAFFQNWWWLGGGCALYVPAALDDAQVAAAVQRASAGWRRSVLADSKQADERPAATRRNHRPT
jgi:hypothetical protein